jgi:hypothetical protein
MLCLLGELDARFRRLFGYLQNDATRQQLEVELLAQVLRNARPEMLDGRDLFSPNTRLLSAPG